MGFLINTLAPFVLKRVEAYLLGKAASHSEMEAFRSFVLMLQNHGVKYASIAAQFKSQDPATNPQPPPSLD